MQGLTAGRFRLYTSNFVLAELHALLLTRISRRTALATLMAIDASDTTIIRVTEDDETWAPQIIAQYDDKNFSLTDASSFAIMDRLGITRAFTFDANFSQYGLTVLTPVSFR
jgi:predicted nucleic acid-binding protein